MPRTATNPETGEKLQLNEATNQWEPATPNLGGKIPTPDPRNVVPNPNLQIGMPPTVERGTFSKILDTLTGGQSSPENLKPLPVEGGTQTGAGGRGFVRGMIPFIEPAVAALDLPFREIPGREDISAGDLFAVSLDQMKRRREMDRRKFGGTTTGMEIAGTLPAGIAVGAIPKVATALKASPALTSGKIGAGFGAVYGGSQADDLANVPEQMLTGGAIGYGTGLGAGFAVDRFLAPSTRAILNSFKTSRAKSTEILSKFMRDIFPDTPSAQMAAKEVASPETALVDLSRGTRQLGRVLSAESPRFGQRAEKMLIDRSKATADRVMGTLHRALGTRGKSIKGTLDGEVKKQMVEGSKLYRQAFAKNVKAEGVESITNEVDELLYRFENVKGAESALKEFKKSLFRNVDGQPMIKTDVEGLHFARKGLRSKISELFRQGKGEIGAELKPLVSMIDDIMPDDYMRAKALWTDQMSSKRALEEGRKILSNKSPEFLADDLADMSLADRNSFLIGAARAIDDKINMTTTGGKQVGFLDKKLLADRIRPIFPDEEIFNDFMARVGKENTFNLTKNAILAGSQTYEGQAAQRALGAKAAEFGEGDLKSGAIRRGVQWLTGIKNDKNVNISDDVIDALSDDLLTAGKVTPAFIDKLMKTPLRAHVQDFINMSIAPASAAAATQGQEAFLRELPPE